MNKISIVLLIIFFTYAIGIGVEKAQVTTTTQPLPATKINPIDGAEMVLVPAGKFIMGTNKKQLDTLLKLHQESKSDWYENEMPDHVVYSDAFYIYRTEVTVAQYRKFCEVTKRKMPKEPQWKWQDTHPIVRVTWFDAKAYADWAAAALPTEAQWEKAARGTDGRIYPWGNEWDNTKCCNSLNANNSTSAVGSYPSGVSNYGVADMTGNVSEWCADWYSSYYYDVTPLNNPAGPVAGKVRVIRGGSWNSNDEDCGRCAYRISSNPENFSSSIGFRCIVPISTK